MDQRVKKAYFEEIEYQTKQINRLKIWLKNLLIISSLIIAIIFFVDKISMIITVILYIALIIIIIALIIINLAIRNGSMNVNNIIIKMEHIK